jgi:glycosyltransferase involved in cell wall biosynthesis
MRILVISDKVFARSMGDGLRLHGLLKPLATRHQFDFLSFARGEEALDRDIRALFHEATLVPAPTARPSPILMKLLKATSSVDFKPTSPQMKQTMAEKLAGGTYDLVLDVAANASVNLPAGRLQTPLVVDAIDEPLLRELRALRSSPWTERPRHLVRAYRFWLYERDVLFRAANCIFAADVDAGVYSRFFRGRPVAVVPNGVDTAFFAPVAGPVEPHTVVFEGNMNFAPNVDTAERLVNEVMPLLVKAVPDVRVVLVGRDPAPAVRSLASERVIVTGTVDDVRPYLARSAVFACPMRLGSGIKNKILQAWAMGRPVVATRESLGGLSAADGVNLLVRDTVEQFAAAVAELLLDPQRAATIGAAGRVTAERQYSWEYQATRFEALLIAAAEHRRIDEMVLPALG